MDLRGLPEYNIPTSSNIINDAHLQSASLKRSRSRSLSYKQDNLGHHDHISLDQILAQDTSDMATVDPDIFFSTPTDDKQKRDTTKRTLEFSTFHDNEKKPRLSLLTEQESNSVDSISNLSITCVDHEQPSCSYDSQAHISSANESNLIVCEEAVDHEEIACSHDVQADISPDNESNLIVYEEVVDHEEIACSHDVQEDINPDNESHLIVYEEVVDHEEIACSYDVQADISSDNDSNVLIVSEDNAMMLPSASTTPNIVAECNQPIITNESIPTAISSCEQKPISNTDDTSFCGIEEIIEQYGGSQSCSIHIQQLFEQNDILTKIKAIPRSSLFHVLNILENGDISTRSHAVDQFIVKVEYDIHLHSIVKVLLRMQNNTGSPNAIGRIMMIIDNVCNTCADLQSADIYLHRDYRDAFVRVMAIITNALAITPNKYEKQARLIKTNLAKLEQSFRPPTIDPHPFNMIVDHMGLPHFKDLMWFLFAESFDTGSSGNAMIPNPDVIYLHMLLTKTYELQACGLLNVNFSPDILNFLSLPNAMMGAIALPNKSLVWLRQQCTTIARALGMRTPVTKRLQGDTTSTIPIVVNQQTVLVTINKRSDIPHASTIPDIFARHTSFHEVYQLHSWLAISMAKHDSLSSKLVSIPNRLADSIKSIYSALTDINTSLADKSDLCTDSIEWEMLTSTMHHIDIQNVDINIRWTTFQNLVAIGSIVSAILPILRDNDSDNHLHMEIIKRKPCSQSNEKQQIVRKLGRAAIVNMHDRISSRSQNVTTLSGSSFQMCYTILKTLETTCTCQELVDPNILRKMSPKRSSGYIKLRTPEIHNVTRGLKALLDSDLDEDPMLLFSCHSQRESQSIEKPRNDLALVRLYPIASSSKTSIHIAPTYSAANDFFVLPSEDQIENIKNNPCILQLVECFSVDKLHSLQKALSEAKRHISFECEHGLAELNFSTAIDLEELIVTILSFPSAVSGFKEHRWFSIIEGYFRTGRSFTQPGTILLPHDYIEILKHTLEVVEVAHQIIKGKGLHNLEKIKQISMVHRHRHHGHIKCINSMAVLDDIGELILRDLVCWLFYQQNNRKGHAPTDEISIESHRSTEIKHLVQSILKIPATQRTALWTSLPPQLSNIHRWVDTKNCINYTSISWLYNTGGQILRVHGIPFPTNNPWTSLPFLDDTAQYINEACSSQILFSLKQRLFDLIHNGESDEIHLTPFRNQITSIYKTIVAISNKKLNAKIFRDADVNVLSTMNKYWENNNAADVVVTRKQTQQIMNVIETLCHAICNRKSIKI